MRTILITLLIISFAIDLSAQNLDVDSIYYTPLPRPGQLKQKRKSFHQQNSKDTIFLNSKRRDEIVLGDRHFYFLSLQTGSLIGCKDCSDGKGVSSTVSFLNGVILGEKFRAGVGVGFDSYMGWQTAPAFASVSWDIFGNRNRDALFIQLNYGFSKAWRQKSFEGYGFKNAEAGRMFSPQIGYRIKYHDLKLSLAVGAKLQRVFTFYEYPTWNWVAGEYQPGKSYSTVKQDMSRLMITIAVGWR